MRDFERLWTNAVRYRPVSHRLKTLVYAVYNEATRGDLDLAELRRALDELLQLLTSMNGRTDANCCAVDRFFANFEGQWSNLPPDLAAILEDMAGTLHDSIYAPQIAAHFESLPEQLLNRLRKNA
jgi:hypothetical protein